MHCTQTIRKYLNWCPNAHALPQQLPVLNDDVAGGAPAQGTGMPAGTGWLNRYHSRVLLWAVFYLLAFMPFVPFFYSVDPMRSMMYVGVIAGLMLFAASGRRLWHSFDLALANEWEHKNGPEGYIILFVVVGIILAAVVLIVMASLSIIPFETALELPAVTVGFAFIPWYVLVLILLWERRMGCILIFDKKTFSFTAERCSGNAHH